MNCEKYLDLIDDFIEFELDEPTADEVSLHVFNCQTCTARLEMLEREKEMYSHYLFEIEPPIDLSERFQAQLDGRSNQTIGLSETLPNQLGWLTSVLNFVRPHSVLTATILFVLAFFGFGLFSLFNEDKSLYEKVDSQPSLPSIQIQPHKGKVNSQTADERKEIAKNIEPVIEKISKPATIKQKESVVKRDVSVRKSPEVKKLSEENLQLKDVQALETESAKQIEKVEQLLRSFRNARLIDGSEVYDVSFEKEQARRLLQTNVALRQKAEFYGTPYTEQLLSKVEPYLLDIANLEVGSAPEQVLEIKERVKKENIIASLQGF